MELSTMERVDAGIDWLEENLSGWRRFIDVDILDMGWEENCILGQYNWRRYGDAAFARSLHLYFSDDSDRAAELGFMAVDLDYSALTAAWKQAIRRYDEEAQG